MCYGDLDFVRSEHCVLNFENLQFFSRNVIANNRLLVPLCLSQDVLVRCSSCAYF
jgi:hypothetical protein